MTVRPTNVNLNRQEAYLEVSWSDEKICRYPLPELREACPCVECRGGHEFMGREFEPKNILELKPARSYKIEGLELVGNYALQPVWDDGHSTGIYSWDYLRRICPEDHS